MQKVPPLIHDDAPVLDQPRLLDYVLGALILTRGDARGHGPRKGKWALRKFLRSSPTRRYITDVPGLLTAFVYIGKKTHDG